MGILWILSEKRFQYTKIDGNSDSPLLELNGDVGWLVGRVLGAVGHGPHVIGRALIGVL